MQIIVEVVYWETAFVVIQKYCARNVINSSDTFDVFREQVVHLLLVLLATSFASRHVVALARVWPLGQVFKLLCLAIGLILRLLSRIVSLILGG